MNYRIVKVSLVGRKGGILAPENPQIHCPLWNPEIILLPPHSWLVDFTPPDHSFEGNSEHRMYSVVICVSYPPSPGTWRPPQGSI